MELDVKSLNYTFNITLPHDPFTTTKKNQIKINLLGKN